MSKTDSGGDEIGTIQWLPVSLQKSFEQRTARLDISAQRTTLTAVWRIDYYAATMSKERPVRTLWK